MVFSRGLRTEYVQSVPRILEVRRDMTQERNSQDKQLTSEL